MEGIRKKRKNNKTYKTTTTTERVIREGCKWILFLQRSKHLCMHLMAAPNAQPWSSDRYLHPAHPRLDIPLSAAPLTRFSMVCSFQPDTPVPTGHHHTHASPQEQGHHWSHFQLQGLPQIPRRFAAGRWWGWVQGRSQPQVEGRWPPLSQDTAQHRARCSCQQWAVAQTPHTARDCHRCTGLGSASCGGLLIWSAREYDENKATNLTSSTVKHWNGKLPTG